MGKGDAQAVQLFAIGDARIVTNAASLDASAQVVFATALFLILEQSKPTPRERLASMLWPGVGRDIAYHRLRQTLLKLRHAGLAVASIGKIQIQLRNRVIADFDTWDVHNLGIEEIGTHRLEPFQGFQPDLSPDYSHWLERKRDHVRGLLIQGFLHRIAKHRHAGEWRAVETCASGLLGLTPLNEEATLALAEALAMRGDKHSATALLDSYLNETGTGPTDLRVQASLMRRRIADQAPPRILGIGSDTSLVGRQDIMTTLGGLLTRVKSGACRAVLLSGAAGIGKSRISSEIAHFSMLQGFSTLRVNCRSSHTTRPLSTFVELVPMLRALPGAIGCSPETLHFLDRLTRHSPDSEHGPPDTTDAAWVYSGVQRALLDIIDAVADESPLLIQIEDVHWMDTSSADILRDLLLGLKERRVAIALTGREAPGAWRENLPAHLRLIEIQPLDDAQSTNLALSILRDCGASMTKSYLDWCVRVAEGNPYFLIELVSHWIESDTEYEVPPSLSSVLYGRLARLDTQSLQVLQTCALLENNSTLSRVEAVLQHSAHELLSAIDSLGSAGMIVVEGVGTDGSGSDHVASRHELLSNVALSQLSAPARRFLHRRIGAVLEAEVDENFSAATLWDCAKHWQLAGDNKRAWHLATSCASHLMKIGLPAAAADAYAKSLAYCGTDEERLEVLRSQTCAFYRMSDWRHVQETAAGVRTLQERLFPGTPVHDDLELMELRAQWQSLDWDSVLEKAVHCVNADRATPTHRTEAGVMALMLSGFKGDTAAMQNIYATIEKLVEEGGVKEAAKLQAQMVYHTNVGDLTQGVLSARRLVQEQISQGDVGDLFRAHCNAAVTCRVAGLFEEAQSHFDSALRIAADHNLSGAEQRAIPLAANMALEIGDTENARNLYVRLCDMDADPANKFSLLERQALGARLALCDGNGAEARRLFRLKFDEACKDPIHHRRTYNLALLIAIDLAMGAKPNEEIVTQLETSFEQSKASLHQSFAAFVLATALKKRGQQKRGRQILQQYVAVSRREAWPAPVHLLNVIEKSCGLA